MLFLQIVLGVGLALDAVVVSICQSTKAVNTSKRDLFKIAFIFGLFQFLMALLGALLGRSLYKVLYLISPWLALILLSLLGINMIRSALKNDEMKCENVLISTKEVIILALATSLDALVAGVTIAFNGLSILQTSLTIGLVTFLLCSIGVYIGKIFGTMFEKRAELIGGIILICVGIKMFLY